MKRFLRSVLTIFASIGLAMQMGMMTASAQSGNGLRLSPVKQDITVERGSSDTFDVILTNLSDQPVSVDTFINDFTSDGVSSSPQLIVDPNEVGENSARDFLQGVEGFELEGNETKTVTVSVAVPQAASPGSYYSAIRYQVAPASREDSPASGTTFSLNSAVSFLVFVNVPGEAEESALFKSIGVANVANHTSPELKDLETSSLFTSSTPNLVAIVIENTGEVFSEPIGQVSITNMFGSEVAAYELNASADGSRSKVLPNSSQTFANSVDFGGFGKFTVSASVSFNQGGAVETRTSTFWVLPIWLIAILIGLIVAAAFAVKSLYSRYV